MLRMREAVERKIQADRLRATVVKIQEAPARTTEVTSQQTAERKEQALGRALKLEPVLVEVRARAVDQAQAVDKYP